MDNGNKPAYPVIEENKEPNKSGLTKREYFAAMAMQGMIAGDSQWSQTHSQYRCAEIAVNYADELLLSLSQAKEGE